MRTNQRGRESVERAVVEGASEGNLSGGGDLRRLRGPQGGRSHSWGIRIGVEPAQQVAKALAELRRGTFEDILGKYSELNGLNSRGEPKRSTVRAILQTLTHLEMVSVRGQTYQLSRSGDAYVQSLGTPSEATTLAAILQEYPAFVQLWDRLQGREHVRHSEITQLFAHEFHYARRPAANFAAFFIGFASQAGLIRRKAGTHAYDTVLSEESHPNPFANRIGTEPLRSESRPEIAPPDQHPAGKRKASADLREVARELGLALADTGQTLGTKHVESLFRALNELRESAQGPGVPRILKVAVDMATHALTRGDDRALRWSVQCFNGLVEISQSP